MIDRFFEVRNCERCNSPEAKAIFIMSWFTKEKICMECSLVENEIKKKLQEKFGPELARRYEGCGRVPTLQEYGG